MLLSNKFTTPFGFELRSRTVTRFSLLNSSNRRNEFFVLAIYLVSVFLILSVSRMAVGDDPACQTSINGIPQSTEIYEISTRHLPDQFRCINFDQPNVEVNKWSGNCWTPSNVEQALPSGGTGILTILYVHGNFMERNNALERFLIVNRYLKEQTDQPYRLLMLSWPSQKERKPLRDVFSNAESAECQSLYFAWMLQRLRNEPKLSVLGFSYGARAVTGGLHLDAGGILPGYAQSPLPNTSSELNIRLGLVAPAIDRNWIERNGRHNLALTHVDSMMNLYNSKDPILRRFRFLDRFSRPIAAGFSGFAGFATLSDPRATQPLTGQTRIRQYDCGSVIGTTHSEKSYYGECPYFRTLIQHLLWKEPGDFTCNASIVP